MAIIKDGVIYDSDKWKHGDDNAPLPDGPVTLSFARWQAEHVDLVSRNTPLGIRLSTSDDMETVKAHLSTCELIVLDIPHFADGRVFSQARLLRERYRYAKELRVRGDFLRDQIFFLTRVGVNSFEFREGTDLADTLRAFTEFSVTYQAAVDNPDPLYRRHSHATS